MNVQDWKKNVQDKSRIEKKKLIPFHPLKNFEIIYYFKNIKGFNGVFPRNNLRKLRNGVYVINLDHSKIQEHIGLLYF